MLHAISNLFHAFPLGIWIIGIVIFILGFYSSTFWLLLALLILLKIAWTMWMHYIQQDFISGIKFVLLEIIPPREVLRSPKAMELFLSNALYQWSIKGGYEQYYQGAVWFWFSLEIASIEGQVHFYIRTPSRVKELIETQMYAQYPQSQVKEVEDYTLAIDEITPHSKWNMYACEWRLEKNIAYPIKTYVDFGLDKDPKEEYKVDPISPVIELFGSMQKDEQMWLQIIIRPSKKKFHTHGTWFGTHDWVTEAKNELDKVVSPYTKVEHLPNGEVLKTGRTPDHLKPVIDGISKKIQKIGFDVGIRSCYVAKKEVYSNSKRRDLRLIFRQYANPYLNAILRCNGTQADAYNGWLLASPETIMLLANRALHAYREREFFHLPMRHHIFSNHNVFWPISEWIKAYLHPETFVLNAEEIATLWHFPGQILKVPTLERVESKEASPPTNLPI